MKILLAIPLMLLSGCGSSTYEDCIFENMKPGMVKVAVLSVRRACRNKFPAPTIDEQVYIDFSREIAEIDKKDNQAAFISEH